MRGLPSCGKSTTAQKLKGKNGIVLETDEYFLSQVGENKNEYNFDEKLMPIAREWIIERYHKALAEGISPIIVDRGNSLNQLSYHLATAAIRAGYQVTFAEPESPWWTKIRELLKDKKKNQHLLLNWAKKLQHRSRNEPPYHRVALKDILRLMQYWHSDLTIEFVLKHFSDKD